MPHDWVNYRSLREELSFIEILHHYRVELKERGEQWQGFCPLPTHEGKRNSPSFSANVGRGIWQCFGCGAKGNLIEFAARMEVLNPDDPGEFRKAAQCSQQDGRERFVVPEEWEKRVRDLGLQARACRQRPPPSTRIHHIGVLNFSKLLI